MKRNDTFLPSLFVEAMKQLDALNKDQKNVERAMSSFVYLCEQNEEELSNINLEKVHATFYYQTLSFNSGTAFCPPPSIDTCLKVLEKQVVGYYHYVTSINESGGDDFFEYGVPLFYQYLDKTDFEEWLPGQHFLDVFADFIPASMKNMFQLLKQTSEVQKLEERASEMFAQWLVKHPQWMQEFPHSFYEETSQKQIALYQRDPNWFHSYPTVPISQFDAIQTRLSQQKLCFNHAHYAFPYIITSLDILTEEFLIGTYCFCTHLDGTVNEELSCTFPFPLNY